jgi:transposase
VNLAMARRYGRAPRGQRVHGAVPQNYGASVSVLGALDWHGMRAAMTVDGATDGAVFVTFLRQVLGPRLRRGELVVLDNLGAHRVAGVAEAIAARGARLRYLPPYSPDFSPMEPGWSKVKTALRAVGARTRRALDRALARALAQVTPQDADGWFRLCGYGLRELAIRSRGL